MAEIQVSNLMYSKKVSKVIDNLFTKSYYISIKNNER